MFAPTATERTTMSTPEAFDVEDVYAREIAPHLRAIVNICKAHEIPMLASFFVKNSMEGEGLITAHLEFKRRKYEPFKRALSAIRYGAGFFNT